MKRLAQNLAIAVCISTGVLILLALATKYPTQAVIALPFFVVFIVISAARGRYP